MKYDLVVRESFQKFLTSRRYLNATFMRTCRDLQEVNDEIKGMLAEISNDHDIVDIKTSKEKRSVTIEYARKSGSIGRLQREITIERHPEQRVRIDELV